MTETTVLLVDDHPLVRSAIRQALETGGLRVVGEAATGAEALALAATAQPDLVILDLDLPGMHGLDVLTALRQQTPGAQVLVLTVSGAEVDLIEAVRRGAAGYATKDVREEELVEAVRAALAGETPMPSRVAAGAITSLAEGGGAASGRAGLGLLTPRELEVLSLTADGLTDRQAAETLRISVRTVEDHVSSVLRKLGAKTRAEAAAAYRDERRSGPRRRG